MPRSSDNRLRKPSVIIARTIKCSRDRIALFVSAEDKLGRVWEKGQRRQIRRVCEVERERQIHGSELCYTPIV